jgi:hypothetical protein
LKSLAYIDEKRINVISGSLRINYIRFMLVLYKSA